MQYGKLTCRLLNTKSEFQLTTLKTHFQFKINKQEKQLYIPTK